MNDYLYTVHYTEAHVGGAKYHYLTPLLPREEVEAFLAGHPLIAHPKIEVTEHLVALPERGSREGRKTYITLTLTAPEFLDPFIKTCQDCGGLVCSKNRGKCNHCGSHFGDMCQECAEEMFGEFCEMCETLSARGKIRLED